MDDKPTKMKEVTWVRFIVGDAIQGEIKTTIDFPNAKMAADYIRQMPYLVDASSSDVIDYITQDWTDDDDKRRLFESEEITIIAANMLDRLFTHASSEDEEMIIDTLQRAVVEGV